MDFDQTIKIKTPGTGMTVFGRYKLERVLGRGGMGVVWLADDLKLERPVALKFLPSLIGLDPAAVKELKTETRRGLELSHPHIVRIYDFVDDEDAAAISMEFVDGKTLSELRMTTETGVFSVEEISKWLLGVCDALDYAHFQRKLIHRDLKPANIMLTSRDAVAKIADFGIARSLSDTMSRLSAAHIGTSGTLPYMSPQQAMGERPQPTDDVYSLGATLYELLSGKPPFYRGDLPTQINSKIPPSMQERRQELEIQCKEAVPKLWEDAIAACLHKEPGMRPSCAGVLAEMLGLKAATVTVRTGSYAAATARTPAQKASSRAPLIAAAATLVVGAGAAAWVFLKPAEPAPTVAKTEEVTPSKPVADKKETPPAKPKGDGRVTVGDLQPKEKPPAPKAPVPDKPASPAASDPKPVPAPSPVASVPASTTPAAAPAVPSGTTSTPSVSTPAPSVPAPGPAGVASSPTGGGQPSGSSAMTPVSSAPTPPPAVPVVQPPASSPIGGTAPAVSAGMTPAVIAAAPTPVTVPASSPLGGTPVVPPADGTPVVAPVPPAANPTNPGSMIATVTTPSSATTAPGVPAPGASGTTPPLPPNTVIPPGGLILTQPVVSKPESGFWTVEQVFPVPPHASFSAKGKRYLLYKTQSTLKELGLYTSTLDGAEGKGTHNAIILFQVRNGLEPNGLLDLPTLVALNLSAEPDKADWNPPSGGGGSSGGGGGYRRRSSAPKEEPNFFQRTGETFKKLNPFNK